MFNKKPKIEFYSLIPEVADIAPIVPAHTAKPSWFKNAQNEFANLAKQPDFGHHRIQHTAKCPGLFNYMRYGWVMTTWQDIIITTNGDLQSFEWRTPVDQTRVTNGDMVGEAVGYHPKEQLSDYQGGWDDALNCVLKIHTPWRCIVPKGYYLLEGPLPYSDEKRFTTMPGFFSQEYGVAQMNVQLKWNVLNGETLIKAGTPIAHYMLVPKDEAELIVSKATPEQIHADKVTKLESTRKFVSDKGQAKCIFAKMFK